MKTCFVISFPGPLDETTASKQDISKSANGSFQTSRSWSAELSQYKIPPSNQAELPFKIMPADQSQQKDQVSMDDRKPPKDETLFTSNRFKVYSAINDSNSSVSLTESLNNSESVPGDSINAAQMLKQLQDLQQQLRKGEAERKQLAEKLAEQQSQNSESTMDNRDVRKSDHSVSRPFMPEDVSHSDLSQYSFTDRSADNSTAVPTDQSDRAKEMFDSPDARSMPVRMSPIGHSLKVEPREISANGKGREEMSAEYSFSLVGRSVDKDQRSTSTPGE